MGRISRARTLIGLLFMSRRSSREAVVELRIMQEPTKPDHAQHQTTKPN